MRVSSCMECLGRGMRVNLAGARLAMAKALDQGWRTRGRDAGRDRAEAGRRGVERPRQSRPAMPHRSSRTTAVQTCSRGASGHLRLHVSCGWLISCLVVAAYRGCSRNARLVGCVFPRGEAIEAPLRSADKEAHQARGGKLESLIVSVTCPPSNSGWRFVKQTAP